MSNIWLHPARILSDKKSKGKLRGKIIKYSMYFYRFFIHMNPCLCITEHLCILYMQLIVSSKGSCLSVSSMFFQTSKLTITTSYEHIYVHQYTNVYDIWTDLHKRKIFCRVQHAFSARDGTPPLLNLKNERFETEICIWRFLTDGIVQTF